MNVQKASFLVTLDALFDTRIGTCYRLNYSLGKAMLFSKKYADRKFDYFAKDSKYAKLWANRDVLTLANSTATKVLFLIQELITNTEQEYAAGHGDFELCIYLNTHPYILTKEELSAFESVIYAHFPQLSKFKAIHLDTKSLTPEWLCTNEIECLVTYHWQDWLECHEEALLAAPQPLLHLVGPRVRKYEPDFKAGEQTEQLVKLLNEESDFEMAEFGTQAYIALRTVPVQFFNSFICEEAK